MDLDDAELEAQLRDTFERAAAPVQGHGVDQGAIRDEVARRRTARTRARWTGGFAVAAAAVAATVILVVMLRPDEDRVETDDSVATQPTTPTTAPPDRPADPPAEGTRPTTSSSTTTTSTTTTSTTATEPSSTTASSAPPLPDFPPEFEAVTHGGEAWGLYLALAPSDAYDAPELAAADQAARAAGYGPTGAGSLACDRGAAEALGADPSSLATVVYFETRAQADQARDAFEARDHSVVGVAHVVTGCLD